MLKTIHENLLFAFFEQANREKLGRKGEPVLIWPHRERETERQRDRDRQRQIQRERDRQTERDRQRQRQRDGWI